MELAQYLLIGVVLLVLAVVAGARYAVTTRRRVRDLEQPPVIAPPPQPTETAPSETAARGCSKDCGISPR